MPITPYLNGQQFDPETKRILGLAFEMTCTALRIGECDDGVKQAIADKIIDLAKSGGRNPDVAFVCKIAKLNTKSPLRGRGAQKSGNFRRRPRGYLTRISAKCRNFFGHAGGISRKQQFRILLIAKAIAIINRNHVLIRFPPPLRRMRFSEATR